MNESILNYRYPIFNPENTGWMVGARGGKEEMGLPKELTELAVVGCPPSANLHIRTCPFLNFQK
jgi:hypothetical protein